MDLPGQPRLHGLPSQSDDPYLHNKAYEIISA